MCDKCKNNHKHYVCVCGKEFETGISIRQHKRRCKKFKLWKIEQEEIARQEKEAKRLPNGMFKCENPKCNKEHDGSYASGRFCSKHCYKQFCSTATSIDGIRKGARKGKPQNHEKQTAPYGTWKCKHCGKILKTKGQLQKHIHDNHVRIGVDGRTCPWNKGLTKETDERVANNAKAVQQSMKLLYKNGYVNPTQTDEYWTEERRHDRSEQKKQLFREHPEKHPNVKMAQKGFISKPEKIAKKWLEDHNEDFISQYRFEADGLIRYVDFYIPDKYLFIEIDGSYWHIDCVELDANKDEIATKYQYKTLRISDQDDIEQKLDEYFKQFKKT